MDGRNSGSSSGCRSSGRHARTPDPSRSWYGIPALVVLWSRHGVCGGAPSRCLSGERCRGPGLFLGSLAVMLFVVHASVVHEVRQLKCPYCADWVKADARVCTHCHALLVGGSGSRG